MTKIAQCGSVRQAPEYSSFSRCQLGPPMTQVNTHSWLKDAIINITYTISFRIHNYLLRVKLFSWYRLKKENKTEKNKRLGRGVAGEMAEQLRVHSVVPGSDSQHPHGASHCLELHFQEVQCSLLASDISKSYTWCPDIYAAKASIHMK